VIVSADASGSGITFVSRRLHWGWLNQKRQQVIDYLVEENRVLREQIGCRRIKFNDDQRCRLVKNIPAALYFERVKREEVGTAKLPQ